VCRKRWSDLSGGQKICIVAFLAVDLALLLAAVFDLKRRSPDEVRGDRRLWFGLVFIDVFGPLAYFTYGRKMPSVTDEEPASALTPPAV
jgi:bacteriorhodopsin